MTNPLEPLTEGWERALAIVAHPDDLEFGAAAAIARWTDQGKRITYCLVTSGEAGIDSMPPEQTRGVREEEQRASAAVVGVHDVEFLGFPDGIIEYGVPLRRALTMVIRQHRPEIVITNNFRDTWDGAVMLNQSDHIATGRATLDAVRDAGNRWVFTDQLSDGLEPWGGVQQVWCSGSPDAKHAVDVTDTFARGVESLRAHDAYIRGLGDGAFDPEEFLDGMGRATGTRLGTRHAAQFEVFPLTLF
ncbi:PIG-L deacetylase family protein [Phytohabitans aurantiacus]|jgi:LmbE family N-acetylglucosaminyl deacetylase|uniref:GlcNAc-PI de-N-acetylase n=1 Tax=Phytohabitans aurantiacus TaxID=3016789 RepID=A0ABQ5QXF0_9ACTN|nr:PIG-L deacetylase family protein [Phytohabitans aurantiacus]GLH99223.1 GlcNAc-PI de-N-acetylase [Phytohabitans aurantiacus]